MEYRRLHDLKVSVIGYGVAFRKIIGQKNILNIGYSGIYGIFFITFIAYLRVYNGNYSVNYNAYLKLF